MIGIDVSNWQGTIDWNAVAAWRGPSGERIEFAAIRATEGASGSNPTFALDPFFVRNWDGCKAAGIARIAYHFARPAWNSAQVELDWHLSQVNYLPGDGCMLDFEDPNAVGDLCGWASGWVQGFDAAQGFWPFFYSGIWYMQPHNLIGCGGLANDGLALADYTFAPHASLPPAPWPVTAITQYSDAGSVGGISGGVDMDFFNGDASQLAQYFKASPPQPTAPPIDPPPPPVEESDMAKQALVYAKSATYDQQHFVYLAPFGGPGQGMLYHRVFDNTAGKTYDPIEVSSVPLAESAGLSAELMGGPTSDNPQLHVFCRFADTSKATGAHFWVDLPYVPGTSAWGSDSI